MHHLFIKHKESKTCTYEAGNRCRMLFWKFLTSNLQNSLRNAEKTYVCTDWFHCQFRSNKPYKTIVFNLWGDNVKKIGNNFYNNFTVERTFIKTTKHFSNYYKHECDKRQRSHIVIILLLLSRVSLQKVTFFIVG